VNEVEVFWSILPDKSIQEYAFMASLAVASRAGNLGYTYITSNCQRTDVARNRLAKAFRELSRDPNDVLVMLDCDHTHPHDTIERLVAHPVEYGVVGALAFRRGDPFFPCFFMRGVNGKLAHPLEFTGELMRCAIVGTGAIAIRRWVLDMLANAGYEVPFWYAYDDDMHKTGEYQSEDIAFGLACEKLGIAHYCDTSLITPHLMAAAIDQTAWERYAELYRSQAPEMVQYVKE
jgi:hypothetical protein